MLPADTFDVEAYGDSHLCVTTYQFCRWCCVFRENPCKKNVWCYVFRRIKSSPLPSGAQKETAVYHFFPCFKHTRAQVDPDRSWRGTLGLSNCQGPQHPISTSRDKFRFVAEGSISRVTQAFAFGKEHLGSGTVDGAKALASLLQEKGARTLIHEVLGRADPQNNHNYPGASLCCLL